MASRAEGWIVADDLELLFVYGTLRPALAVGDHARLVRDLEPLGAATVRGGLVDLGGYPGLVGGVGLVHGELLRVSDPARLAALDDYEECGGPDPLFRRARTVAHLPDGSAVEAWVYWYGRPAFSLPVIAGGDYAAHVKGR